MLKWLIVSVNFLVTLLVGSYFGGDVSLQVNVPQTVTAGNEFQVTVKFSKGKLASFSRFIQELPAGLKATSINSSNADFTFKDNKVRFIWLKMPDGDSITVTYTIKVDQRLKGNFDLTGKFSYIDDNERMTVESTPMSVNINPNPNIDPKLIVDIKDFKDKVIPELISTDQMPVAAIRQKPIATGDADNSYIVNVLIYKENAQKFAKIEEAVPAGFTALKIDSKEGIFVFKDGLAKFLWMSMPSAPYYMVSYRLVPNAGVTTPPTLTGQFSYMVDEKTVIKDIVEKDQDLASLSPSDVKRMAQQLNASPVNIPIAVLLNADTTKVIAQTTETKSKPVVDNKIVDNNKIVQPKEKVQPKNKWQEKVNKVSKAGDIDLAYKLEPEQGVYFRVQLAAGHKPINIKRYFNKFKIADEVRAEEHEGWHKYSIGSFADYKLARDYRVHIWNTTPIADAFVSAYNTGQRITVQEALMVTNQKWYK
jgi:hypothetical protein